MNYFHTGAAGDLIYGLIAIKQRPGHVYLPETTSAWAHPFPSQNRFYENLRRLLEPQEYVLGVHRADHFDDVPKERVNMGDFGRTNRLAHGQCEFLGMEFPGWDPWLQIEPKNPFGHDFWIVNRTARYQSWLDWKNVPIPEPAYFIGHPDEHEAFQVAAGKELPYLPTDDLYEMAQVIAASRGIYCNLSSACAIAQGLGAQVHLEKVHDGVLTGREHLLNP